LAVNCERAILARLDAGCRAPVAVYAIVSQGEISCESLVISPDGRRCLRRSGKKPVVQVEQLVDEIVGELKAAGADEIIADCRKPGDGVGP
jgi:hydroxymethylbilane synthase